MYGWHISVFRQQSDGGSPASFDTAEGPTLAVWQAKLPGLDWIDALVDQGKALNLGGNGYPSKYTAMAKHLVGVIRQSPPEANEVWSYDIGDILLPGWLGKTTLYDEVMEACRPEEWLIIEVWDES
jgi:hypothetical protein